MCRFAAEPQSTEVFIQRKADPKPADFSISPTITAIAIDVRRSAH
jgi:hypothetical protein